MRHFPERGPDVWRFTLLDGLSARWHDQSIELGPPQRRAVLAALVSNAGRTVSTEQLMDAVWDDRPPDKAPATLQAHISALRRALEPGREPHAPSRIIRSVNRGYLIDTEDIEVDVFEFTDRVSRADQARSRGDLRLATELLRAALAGFRTSALPGVPGPFAAQHRDMLAEQRLAACVDLVELDLLNQPDEPIDHDLTSLLATHPYHERLLAAHMRLLDHNGRRADALAAYAQARRKLVADLGVEPNVELRRLQQRLLSGDAGGPVPAPRLVVGQRSVGETEQDPGRPPRQGWLVGRQREVAGLVAALTTTTGPNAPIVLLHGQAGVGKTATAAWVAQQLADTFPGGRYFLPADVTGQQRVEVLRRVERAGRALLILDDVATATDIRPELPVSPEVTVLITSRYRGRLVPFARRIELPPLPPADAAALFRTVVGGPRCDAEPVAADRLVTASAGVPSVLLSVADLLCRRPEWRLNDYVDRLATDGEWSLDVHLRPLLDRGYAELDPLLAKAFRMAAIPVDRFVTPATVAAMTTWPVDRIGLLLEDLVDRHLMVSTVPGQFGFPPLVHRYALERTLRVETEAELGVVGRRLAEHLSVEERSGPQEPPEEPPPPVLPTGPRSDAA
jgi:DNA-binding SARP family transcriptional activator